ncbi:ribosomal protein L31 [Rhizophagus irregularis DAOM 181602=DAOM 197198]|nr:ribosomal protein L31 [Rhizophagus irregularis DAOM 181602=DAOM 197198]
MLNLFNVSSTNEHILYLLISLIFSDMNITKLSIITKLYIPPNYPSTLYKRSYATTKSFIRPRLFTQQIVLTNGATYTLRTTSPKPRIKLIKDTRNHPLWNPSQLSQALDDDSGQLSKFIKKFGDEEYDLEFMESDENLPVLTSNDMKSSVFCASME